jgi:hypothetical protein
MDEDGPRARTAPTLKRNEPLKKIRIFVCAFVFVSAASAAARAQTQTPAQTPRVRARVCMDTPEYRQFDFWVGDWEVFGPSGRRLGTNKVVLLQDGCIVEENWASARGGTGQSFNFYNPVTKRWHQSYMDSGGENWMMDGEYKDGALRYEGFIYSPNSKVRVRMTFTNLGPDKVRQTAETSADDGGTWTPVWDGTYVRKR